MATATVLNYSFEDIKPINGTNYYRLKQIDKDGKFSLSNVVALVGSKSDKFEILNVYPNPTVGNISINFNSVKDETIQLIITDMVGRVVMQQNNKVTKGENTLTLQTATLPNGNYSIKALCSSSCQTTVVRFNKN